ncbi:hydroxyethylthiazole kinase [Paucilactobacillus suebicus]|uniref:Hydroxyethylthiazole kinase n=1 Tax=Paucilactobacillus suebicus DSM 5007 = KCTC 3549 TaxID=1423807 RepID=A0A0R1VUI5_9LACO|nr:hydroxyethylthiazole kinase [Paucilactobacillus suebicus]KRM09441.1 hydroxyethylthiazole kinase [Paucilactobacillus suebicus DSM 5007 = KCTC 3549]
MHTELLNDLRNQNPIVFNISNFVTVQDVANGINAIGASPIMSQEIDEAPAMVQISSAVTINIGTLTTKQIAQAKVVGETANQYHKPVVLDPVAVGAVKYRLDAVKELMNDFKVDIIRGNAGEIAALADIDWQAKGIDAGTGNQDLDLIAKTCAQKHQCTVILSGVTDVISDGEHVVHVKNGTTLFQLHVGSGDMLSSVVAAFAAVNDNLFEAAQTACAVFATTGQIVAERLQEERPGTFSTELMDELHLITVDEINAKLEVESK